MTRVVSLGTQIEQLDGLRGTNDLNDWEDGFVEIVVNQYEAAGKSTLRMSAKVAEKIEQIWRRHFA